MSGRLTSEQHKYLREQAWNANLRGVAITVIARQLGISDRTVHRLLREAREIIADFSDPITEQEMLDEYIEELRLVKAEAWAAYRNTNERSQNKSNLLGIVMNASEKMARAKGVVQNVTRHVGPDGKGPIEHQMNFAASIKEAMDLRKKELEDAEKPEDNTITLLPSPVDDAEFYQDIEDATVEERDEDNGS